MKSEFKPRPQSKRLGTGVKPPSRYVNTQQAKSTFQQGKAEQAKENYQRAIELYIRATVYDPNFYQAYCNIGSCYRALKQYNESRKYYQKSISIKKDDAISHYNLGNVLRLLGDYQSSINHYSFVIGLKQDKGQDIGSLYLNSLVNLGICYKNKYLFDKACQCCQKAYKLDANDETCLFNYAMSIAGSIQGLDQEIFQEVVRQKADKAIHLFKKYIEIKKGNEMLEFQLLRMSLIKDKSNENIQKVMEQLKSMLQAPNCTLADQINSELGHCLKLLKDYQASASHYQKSLSNFNKRKESSKIQNIYDVSNDEIKQEVKPSKITEEEGIKLIEQGLLEQVLERIKQLDQGDLVKHVLEIAVELNLIDESEDHLNKADNIYRKFFTIKGKEIPMDQISIEGHKTIGQLLALQGNFKESITHFQYITSKINSEQEKSKIHSFLGNDYEAMGDMNKALEEYKIALSSQPDNYELNYNLGCCFYEQVSYEEAKACFQRALGLIERDSSLSMETKQLYTADCLIVLATCIGQLSVKKSASYDIFYRTWTILQQVLSSSSGSGRLEERKILKFYLEWADVLEEKMNETSTNKRGQEYRRSKQLLLEVYICLLDMRGCPDEDAIRNNSATIYYEDGLYVNSLINFNHIQSQEAISYNNIALTYLHLHEHFMASEQILKINEENDCLDPIEMFNKELICWIYGFKQSQNQTLLEQFKNQSDEAMIYRLQYSKIVINAITRRVSQATNPNELSEVNRILQTSAQSEFLLQFLPEAERPKLKALVSILKENKKKAKDQVDPSLLALALKESTNPKQDLNQIIKRCNQSPELSQSVVEVLINLFVFRNQSHLPTIRTVLQTLGRVKTENIVLNLDRRVTVTPQMTTNQYAFFDVKKLDDLLAHILRWESEIECKFVTLMKVIEKCYYRSNFRRPLEYQYTLPKHRNWNQDNITFFKIANIVLNLFPTLTFSVRGKTLKAMKAQIYKQLEDEVSMHHKKKDNFKLSFNQKFTPIVMYGYFQSKNDCLIFLKQLQKQSSGKGGIDIGRETQEINILVSGIVRLVCQWQDFSSTLNLIRLLNENPLPIDVQSVIALEGDLYILKESSQECCQLIQQIPILK